MAAQALRDAGYPLVLEEVSVGGLGSRADAVAYAPASDGGLRPAAVVEVKKLSNDRARDDALDQLADRRHTLSTRLHYVFDGATWFEADSGLRELRQIPGPARNEELGPGRLADPLLVDRLLGQQWWRAADTQRGERDVAENFALLLKFLAEQRSIQVGDARVPAEDGLLWMAARRLALRVLSDRRDAHWTTDQTIARAMATLAGTDGQMYLDPFCGVGSLLWHTADRLQANGRSALLHGQDINAGVASMAQSFARLCPVPLSITLGDAFHPRTAAGAVPTADRVLAQPPLGLRLNQPYLLGNGEETFDGDLASLDVCLQALRPGGRMVLQQARGWTTRSGASLRYRQFLAETTRVAAIVGLPASAMRSTAVVPSVITIIEKEPPSETFVAQLEQDWQQQLSDDGDAMRALQSHLGGPAEASGLL